MQGIIVDYCGVLDGHEEEQQGWRSLLAVLRQSGVKSAILSNDPGGPGAEHIRDWKTDGIVDAVILSGEIGHDKPSPEAFEAAARALELDHRDCVLVDDSIINVRGAVEAGLVGVYYQQFERAAVEIGSLFGLAQEF